MEFVLSSPFLGGAARRTSAPALSGSRGFALSPVITQSIFIASCLSQCPVCDESVENDLPPKPFFTGLIVQCFERNYFLIPVGIHESPEALMSFPLAQVKTGAANPTGISEHPLGFCIFGIWIILPPGPTASCKCC